MDARPDAADHHTIESFPFGSWLGGLRYGMIPATPSLLATMEAMAGLALQVGFESPAPWRYSSIV